MPTAGRIRTAAPRLRSLASEERGAVSVQLVVLVPAVMFIIMAVIQFALTEHAHHIAQSAASKALAAARAENATGGDGQAAAAAVLDAIGDDVLRNAHVTVTRDAQRVRVEVSGEVLGPLPGVRVRAVAVGFVEQWVPDTRSSGGG